MNGFRAFIRRAILNAAETFVGTLLSMTRDRAGLVVHGLMANSTLYLYLELLASAFTILAFQQNRQLPGKFIPAYTCGQLSTIPVVVRD